MKWTARLAAVAPRLSAHGRLVGGTAQGLMSAVAAIVAYWPAKTLGLHEGFWGSVTAVAVVQVELSNAESSARDQFAGAAIGGLIGAAVASLLGQTLIGYGVAVLVSAITCWVLNLAAAARMAASTVTILLLVPPRTTVAWTLFSRIVEVTWGVAVAIAIVWLVNAAKTARIGETPE